MLLQQVDVPFTTNDIITFTSFYAGSRGLVGLATMIENVPSNCVVNAVCSSRRDIGLAPAGGMCSAPEAPGKGFAMR